MYYNVNKKILLRKIPKNLIKPDGSLFINFDQQDIDTLSDYGYYTVRNDNDTPPTSNSIELTDKKSFILKKPYVDIIREWTEPVIMPPIIRNPDVLQPE
jgi:hypothetical protein